VNLFLKLVEILKTGLPAPVFTDEAAVLAWLNRMTPSEAAFIVAMATQFKAKGAIELELPSGETVAIAPVCQGGNCVCYFTEADAAKACAAAPEAFGDGKWLEIVQKIIALIPAIVTIFSLFVAAPVPSPDPVPPVNS
jgi:hypothetical protein